METNGNMPYLKVEEVDAAKVKWHRFVGRNRQKVAFAIEVALRLEQTKPGRCVQFLFADKKNALSFRDYTKQIMCKKLGVDFVVSQIVPTSDGQCWVVFTRGKQWKPTQPDWIYGPIIRPKSRRVDKLTR